MIKRIECEGVGDNDGFFELNQEPRRMKLTNLERLKMLAETDFDGACVWADHNIPSLSSYFDTWAKNCGASREVFVGHTVKMLIDINT